MQGRRSQALLAEAYTDADRGILEKLGGIATRSASAIVANFYDNLMADEDAARFLKPQQVNKRLRHAMSAWTRDLFRPSTPDEVEAFADRLLEIGHIHARINIPLDVMYHGMSVYKAALTDAVVAGWDRRESVGQAVTLAGKIADQAFAVMTSVYVGDIIGDARRANSLRMHVVGTDTALQIERLRVSLFDWGRRFARLLLDRPTSRVWLPSIRETDFALWLEHKGALLVAESDEIGKLNALVDAIEALCGDIACCCSRSDEDGARRAEGLDRLDQLMARSDWLLKRIVAQTLALESGRDPLTGVFNRRFLRVVLQREIEFCQKTKAEMAVILVDIDHFKRVNDEHGHDAGDAVLTQVGETLASNVRASDFVFRYGGEEFLVLINGADAKRALSIAENLRERIAARSMSLPTGRSITITVSAGVAPYDGDPNYSHLVTRADRAMLEAKEAGRDQSVLSRMEEQGALA